MTSTTFIYCGATRNSVRPELLRLLAGNAENAQMRHLLPWPGPASYTDFAEQLRQAEGSGRCVQLLFDCRDHDCRREMSGYLEAARDVAVSPRTLELAMLCDSAKTGAGYGRLIADHCDAGKRPTVWSVVAENSDRRIAAVPFIRLLAALALADYPSRMHGFDSLSSIRNRPGVLIDNRILWFSFPTLASISTALLRAEVWRCGFANQSQGGHIMKLQELLLRHGVGKNEPEKSARSTFSARVNHFRVECLPQTYDLVAGSSVNETQAAGIFAQIASELENEGFGPRRLRSQSAAAAIQELAYELPSLASEIESDARKVEKAAAEFPPLEEWIRECRPIVAESVGSLRASSWSVLELISSTGFQPLRRRGEPAWQAAVELVRGKLLSSFVLWKHGIRERLGQDFSPVNRVLEFLPPELTTDSNEELWPLKDHVALIGQRENPFL